MTRGGHLELKFGHESLQSAPLLSLTGVKRCKRDQQRWDKSGETKMGARMAVMAGFKVQMVPVPFPLVAFLVMVG
ncbi:hypothetical protein BJX62DRAFT_197680 [Aspergillus germanicus]